MPISFSNLIKLPTCVGSEIPMICNKPSSFQKKKTLTSMSLNTLKPLTVWITTNSSVSQFSCSVVSNSLQTHTLQHSRLPCPSQTPRLTQTHAHWVGDAIQLFHSLLSPSPPTFTLSEYQDLFQGVGFSHRLAKVLEFWLQHQSFQWIFRTDFL